MTGRILLIGDKSKDAKALHAALRKETHFLSRVAPLGEAAPDKVVKFKPDIAVLCPESRPTDMYGIFRALKKESATAEIPVIAVLSEDELRSSDLPEGLSEVFCRPLRISECVSRILILYRRINRISDKNLIRSGDLAIDVSRYQVTLNGRKVDLTYTEYELLKFFMTHPDQVFHRDVLLNRVWGYEYYGGVRTVDVHVRRLRSKIEYRSRKFIDTVRNIGYKFINQED